MKYNLESFIHHIAAHFAEFGRDIGHDEFKEDGIILLEGEFQDLIYEELQRLSFTVEVESKQKEESLVKRVEDAKDKSSLFYAMLDMAREIEILKEKK